LGSRGEAVEPHPAAFVEGYGESTSSTAAWWHTTAGGDAWSSCSRQHQILVVALGGNDAFGGSVSDTRSNLAIIDWRLAGRRCCWLDGSADELGTDYRDAFRNTFAELGRQYAQSISYIPFLLEGVAGNPALNQADGIHPNAEGAKIIGNLLYPKLRDIVDQISNSIR
jgi:acyl-CoA thioesterase-1